MGNTQDTVKARLQGDLPTAMKARDEVAVSTIRMLLAALTNAEVAGSQAVELTDEQAIGVLRTEAKKRVEAAELYEQAGRADSATKERAELAVIENYLPAALDAAELERLVDLEVSAAAANGMTGPKALGGVIKAVRDRVGAGADGGAIAALVKAKLT